MKKIFRMAAFLAAAVALFSCTPAEGNEDGNGDGNGNTVVDQALKFTLGEPEVEATQVTILVEHDGDKTNKWHYVVTAKTSKIDEAINAEVQRLLTSETSTPLQSATKKNVIVKDLTPETEYTFIAFGLTSTGTVYGTPASVDFTTSRGAVTELVQTDEWAVSYERGEYDGQTAEIFTIACEENLSYYISYVETWYLEAVMETYNMTVADYAFQLGVYEFQDYLNYGYTLADLIITGPDVVAFPRMVSDEYMIFVIGFTPKGELTGTFSADVVTVVEEEATPEYTQWLGTWQLTGSPYSYEYEGETYEFQNSFTIDVLHYDNNYKYAIAGWECGENQEFDFTDAFGEPIYFPVSYAEGMIGFEEYFIDYIGSDASNPQYAFGLWGICDVTVGTQVYEEAYIGYEGLTMAAAVIGEDGTTGTITGLSYSLPEYGMDLVEYTGMLYMGIPMSDNLAPASWNPIMKFPITMEKVADAPAATPSAMKKVSANTARPETKVRFQNGKKIENKPLRTF